MSIAESKPIAQADPTFTWLDLIHVQAGQAPDAPALLAPGREPIGYGQVFGHLQRTARQLRQAGIGRTDRVVVVLPGGPETALACLAVAACATAVPMNPGYSEDEYSAYLSGFDAKALIVSAGQESPCRAPAAARGLSILELQSSGVTAGLFTLNGAPTWDGKAPERPRPNDVAFLIPTSGTTAQPKLAPLTFRNLHHAAANVRRSLALTPQDRCLDIMPLYHAHGLVICLLASLFSGGSVIIPDKFDAASFPTWLEELRPTWYSAAPAFHRAILDQTAGVPGTLRHHLRFIRSSAAALPRPWLEQLETVFSCPVCEGYGMTECAVITGNPLPPLPRKAGSVGVAVGPEMAVLDPSGVRLAAGEHGEVVVRSGPESIAAYLDNAAANAAAFSGGWFHTGDEGYFDPDGYLFLTGRLKDIINRGGEKIAPGEIEAILMELAGVREAVAFPVPHPRLGEDVGVAIVLHEGSTLTSADVLRFVAPRLAAFKWPHTIVIAPELPKGATGKVQRRLLAQQLGLSLEEPASDGEADASRTPDRIESEIASMVASLLKVDHVDPGADFINLGGDSIKIVQLLNRVRRSFGVEVPLATFLLSPTIRDLASAVRSLQGQATPSGSPVIIAPAAPVPPPATAPAALRTDAAAPGGALDFSLYFFSADGSTDAPDKYRMLLESARFADSHGFKAIWLPERHFHPFGGLYPNAAVLAAALATITTHVRLRAGSVVVPFHDPLRLVEDWSVVDNLSEGRVEVACAPGWHPNDFVLAPETYARRKEIVYENLASVQQLWRGDSIRRLNGTGQEIEVKVYPRPLQPKLPIWLPCHSDSSWERAGELGHNVVTTVWMSTLPEIARQVALYRGARTRSGFDPTTGKVALMLHTYVAESEESARSRFIAAFGAYADTFVALRQSEGLEPDDASLTGDDRTYFAERLLPDRALVGDPQTCLERALALRALGIDEVACLIDYGVPFAETMIGLYHLSVVKERAAVM